MVFTEQVHKYVSENAIHYLEQTRRIKVQKIITIHLGCCSTAIKDGKVLIIRWVWSNERIDYGTRSGDVDQSVIFI
jgi:acetate kinase